MGDEVGGAACVLNGRRAVTSGVILFVTSPTTMVATLLLASAVTTLAYLSRSWAVVDIALPDIALPLGILVAVVFWLVSGLRGCLQG